MKLDSKYFDSIRVKKGRADSLSAQRPVDDSLCQWNGCSKRGQYKAPKGRSSEGEYFFFCQAHVTAYNKNYNYFQGMNDSEVADFQKSATTGHRPTWSMGVNGAASETLGSADPSVATANAEDPLHILKTFKGRPRLKDRQKTEPKKRTIVQKGALKHLSMLNLDGRASPEDIRTQFKALVKLHHPDHNGGDRSSEDRFREVLAAYNYLKQSGLC